MATDDLAGVDAVAARVHPDFPEDHAVFAERLRLHPAGCRVLSMAGDTIAGYVISHPWELGRPPALNVLIGSLPGDVSTYYIHDLALLPELRGSGAASEIVRQLVRHARELGLPSLSLVAVSGSTPFWAKQGFAVTVRLGSDGKLQSYGEDARLMSFHLA
ncbi:GNAT family N-acetyltransferase [Bradyrhizobium sp. HKCCYLS2038]|uniref:GNAT family N-acetyltransferase n=1 Tax=unclassified Bradyrhizobium TaxID=2631580 RepID=UPI003EC0EB80